MSHCFFIAHLKLLKILKGLPTVFRFLSLLMVWTLLFSQASSLPLSNSSIYFRQTSECQPVTLIYAHTVPSVETVYLNFFYFAKIQLMLHLLWSLP